MPFLHIVLRYDSCEKSSSYTQFLAHRPDSHIHVKVLLDPNIVSLYACYHSNGTQLLLSFYCGPIHDGTYHNLFMYAIYLGGYQHTDAETNGRHFLDDILKHSRNICRSLN